MNLKRLLREFEPSRRERDEERRHWELLSFPFREVVKRAAMAETRIPGKMDRHQHRVGRKVLRAFTRRLSKQLAELERAGSFEELHQTVVSAKVAGVGELAFFDTSLRIGYHRRLRPDRVYLHAGARDGARALDTSLGGKSVAVTQLPRGLQSLECDQLEHFLCVMAPDIAEARGASRSRSAPKRRC